MPRCGWNDANRAISARNSAKRRGGIDLMLFAEFLENRRDYSYRSAADAVSELGNNGIPKKLFGSTIVSVVL